MRELKLDSALYKQYLWSWWQNPISKTSLRLTKAGHDCLVNFVKLESHSMKVRSNQLGRSLKIFLLLDRLIVVEDDADDITLPQHAVDFFSNQTFQGAE